MKGQVFKMCTRCTRRRRYRKGDRRCPGCGAGEFSWYYSVDLGAGPDGNRRRKKQGGFRTEREAQKALRDVLVKIDRGRFVDPSKLTVAQFLQDEWLPAMQLSIARTTWDGYRGIIERYIIPRVGDVGLRDLKAPKINWLYADVRDNGRVRGDEPLSLKTVREVHVCLHRALEDAVRWDYLEYNPSDKATAPSATTAKNQRKKAIRTWTSAEVNQFARLHRDHPFFALWLLAASTGMRRSELLGLRWKDIDFTRGLLAIRQVLVKAGGKAEFKDAPKSAHGYRTIRLPAPVMSELAEVRRRQLHTRLESPAWHDHDLVFCRDDGLPWHPDHVTDTVREMIQVSDLPPIRPLQDLRHTHATLLLADGENAKVVQERLGHHSHSFTADTYQHVMPGMDEAAATRFYGLVFGPDDTPESKESDDA